MTIINRILTTLRRFLRPTSAPPLLSSEELQRLFTARYRSFRELLAANTNTLEAMAELEKALRDGRTLSMTFIRSRCTLVTVNVYKIIHNLNKIADGRYSELERIFSRLQQSIETLLAGNQGRTEGDPVLDLERIGRIQADLTGEKMANLGEAGSLAGILIPPGFALTAVATRLFFQRNQLYPKINHQIQQMDITNLEDLHRKSVTIQEMIRNCPLPPELESLLFDHFDRLAVRRLIEDLMVEQMTLTRAVAKASTVAVGASEAAAEAAVDSWIGPRQGIVEGLRASIDEIVASGSGWTFAKLTIANSVIREIASSAD